MDELNPETAKLFAAKEARRHRLAALPYPEKVRIVIQLQQMAAPLLRAQGKTVRAWQSGDSAEVFQPQKTQGTQKID